MKGGGDSTTKMEKTKESMEEGNQRDAKKWSSSKNVG